MASDEIKQLLEAVQRQLRIMAYAQAEASLRQQGLPTSYEAVKQEIQRLRYASTGR